MGDKGLVTLVIVLTIQDIVKGSTLIETVKSVANEVSLKSPGEDASAAVVTPPVPGKMNICENLCPKWCQRVEDTERNSTDCHYICGNLCNKKIQQANPYIGDSQYEVVPSEYHFNLYDTSGDKLISVEEFSRTEKITVDEAMGIFRFADFNNDGFIDTDEFQGGPMVFTVQMAAELSNIAKTGDQSTTVQPNQ